MKEKLEQAKALLEQAADLIRDASADMLKDKSFPVNAGKDVLNLHNSVASQVRETGQKITTYFPQPK